MDNKSKIILLASIITLSIIISGCADSGQDITPIFNYLPEVQQFLQEHPNAKITVTYWTEEEVTEISDEINIQCDKNINPRALYKATISEGELKIISWIDAETQIVICTSSQGTSGSTSTPTATITSTATATPTATPTPAETPRPYVVACTVSQKSSERIEITFAGGPDAEFLQLIEYTISGDGYSTVTGTSPGRPCVGETYQILGNSGDFAERDHVVIMAKFDDGTTQVILDTYT